VPAERVSHPWRRFPRFSVRGLVVVVLVIGVGLGWIVRRVQMQREAVAAIRNGGGIVFYDWEWCNGLTNLSSLILDGTQVSDAGLAHLHGLTNLGSLSLGGTQVSDAGLPHLTGLVRLSVLWLGDTRVTDAGIRKLKQALPSLTIYH
jgi:hypothetical protein